MNLTSINEKEILTESKFNDVAEDACKKILLSQKNKPGTGESNYPDMITCVKNAMKEWAIEINETRSDTGNQIELLKEDLECIHSYLDDLNCPTKDDNGKLYSIVGRIKNKNEWISAEDRLPENESEILVFQPNEHKQLEMFVCGFKSGNFLPLEENDIETNGKYEQLHWYDEITHWAPLPKAPIANKTNN